MGDEHDSSNSPWVRLLHLVNKSAAKELTVCCSQQSATRKVEKLSGEEGAVHGEKLFRTFFLEQSRNKLRADF